MKFFKIVGFVSLFFCVSFASAQTQNWKDTARQNFAANFFAALGSSTGTAIGGRVGGYINPQQNNQQQYQQQTQPQQQMCNNSRGGQVACYWNGQSYVQQNSYAPTLQQTAYQQPAQQMCSLEGVPNIPCRHAGGNVYLISFNCGNGQSVEAQNKTQADQACKQFLPQQPAASNTGAQTVNGGCDQAQNFFQKNLDGTQTHRPEYSAQVCGKKTT